MIHTVVLDFDGTLVNSNGIKRQGFLTIARNDEGGEEIMNQIIEKITGDRTAIIRSYLQERDGGVFSSNELADALKFYNETVDEAVASAPEMCGASALLSALHQQGLRLVLSSATPEKNLLEILSKRGWLGQFHMVAGAPREKIATLRSLISLQTTPAQIAVVGDGVDDKKSAEQIGCRFFPVGEARGVNAGAGIYTLPEVCSLLTS